MKYYKYYKQWEYVKYIIFPFTPKIDLDILSIIETWIRGNIIPF